MGWLIYLLGVILSYITGRFVLRKVCNRVAEQKYTWDSVVIVMLISTVSFFGVLVFLITWAVVSIVIYAEGKEPPKWL